MLAKKASKKQEKTIYCPDSWYDPNPALTDHVLSGRPYTKGPPVNHLKVEDRDRVKIYQYQTITSCKNRMIKNEGESCYEWSTQAEALEAIKKNVDDFIETFYVPGMALVMRSPLQLRHNKTFTKFSYVIRLVMVTFEMAESIEGGILYDGKQ